MINGRSVIVVIPARAGSKGLPAKNMRQMCGRPLIEWTIRKAQLSAYVDVIVVSTDSEEIAAFSRSKGADVPFLRPSRLASDTATSYQVVDHALNFFKEHRGREFDYTVLLEPTSPLREDDDVDRMLAQLDQVETRFDGIVSVGQANHSPSVMKRLDGEAFERFCPELATTSRRQDDEPAFFPFGVAYIAKTGELMLEQSFYLSRCTWFKIQRYQEYEVDDLYDFLCVERVMAHEWNLS
jgi:CMP-N-acetylneuraminic acid synthetase